MLRLQMTFARRERHSPLSMTSGYQLHGFRAKQAPRKRSLVDQRLVIGDACPFPVYFHPGISKTAPMDEGLTTIGAFGSIGAGDDGNVSIQVDSRG